MEGQPVEMNDFQRYPEQMERLMRAPMVQERLVLSSEMESLKVEVLLLASLLEEERGKRERLEQMVLAMWDAPGMPGAQAVQEEFEK